MMAWAVPPSRTARSPRALARNQLVSPSGEAPAPEQYTYRETPAPAAAATSRSVPRWSNASNVYPLRGFSTGKVGKVSTWITTRTPLTARWTELASRTSPETAVAPMARIRADDRSGWAVMTDTWPPSRTRRRTTAEPMNPLPPATRITPPSGHQAPGEGSRIERDQVAQPLPRAHQYD